MSAFCSSRVVAFFDALRGDAEAHDIMKRRSSARDCAVPAPEGTSPEECRVELLFMELTSDPEGTITAHARGMLRRVEGVTTGGGGASRAARALLFLHGSTADRHRRGWDFGTSTLPPKLGTGWGIFFHALPSSWGLTPNIRGGGEFTWEVRYHLESTPWAIAVPLHWRPRSQIGTDGDRNHTLWVPGTRLEYTALPVNSRIGFQLDQWLRPDDGLRQSYKGSTIGLFLSVGGRFNVTYTRIPDGLPFYRLENSTIVTISAGDLNGLAYWAVRFLRS
jgi:hypothetical protein